MNRHVISGLVGTLLLSACTPAPKDPALVLDAVQTQRRSLNEETPATDSIAAQLGAGTLWKRPMKKGRDGVVAIIGTGVDYRSRELSSALWINSGEYGDGKSTDGLDNDGNGYPDDLIGFDFRDDDNLPFDRHGIDTMSASLIAGQGVVEGFHPGINPLARLMVLRTISSEGSLSMVDLANAIQYAVQKQADIIVINYPKGVSLQNRSRLIASALKQAQNAKIHVVLPAGNSYGGVGSPLVELAAGFDNTIVVGASKGVSEIAEFSGLGPTKVHLLAPGDSIEGLHPRDAKTTMSATMLSASLVAGALSLLAQLEGVDPYGGAREAILRNVRPIESARGRVLTNGVLNLDIP